MALRAVSEYGAGALIFLGAMGYALLGLKKSRESKIHRWCYPCVVFGVPAAVAGYIYYLTGQWQDMLILPIVIVPFLGWLYVVICGLETSKGE